LENFSCSFENAPFSALLRQNFEMYKYAGGGRLLAKKTGFMEIFSNFSEM